MSINNLVSWNGKGDSFIIKDRILIENVLENYFTAKTFDSLRRQLAYYEFVCLHKDKKSARYRHKYFKRNKPHLLHLIKKSEASQKISEEEMKRDLIILRKAIKVKKMQIEHLEANIPLIKEANKMIKKKLIEAKDLLTLNIINNCKWAYNLYFLSEGRDFIKTIYSLSNELHKNDVVDWNEVIEYKNINFNMGSLYKNLKFFSRNQFLDGRLLKMFMESMEFPDNDVTDIFTKYLPRTVQDLFYNNNVVYYERDAVLDYFHGAYEIAKMDDFARTTNTFKVLYPVTDCEEEKAEVGTSKALYNLSVDNVSKFGTTFKDGSSINTYNLFYKSKNNN